MLIQAAQQSGFSRLSARSSENDLVVTENSRLSGIELCGLIASEANHIQGYID